MAKGWIASEDAFAQAIWRFVLGRVGPLWHEADQIVGFALREGILTDLSSTGAAVELDQK